MYRLLKAQGLVTSPAFIVIKAADAFKDKTTAPNQLWQTDFTYLKVIGWGWFDLSSVLDDFSRLHRGLEAVHRYAGRGCHRHARSWHCGPQRSGPGNARPIGRVCCPITGRATLPATWPDGSRTARSSTCVAPRITPMTQGKIQRWHQTLKNRILLENYFLPGDLEAQITAFVEYYNNHRYHESIDNLTPADVYFGRGKTILAEREIIKRKTIAERRLQHQLQS